LRSNPSTLRASAKLRVLVVLPIVNLRSNPSTLRASAKLRVLVVLPIVNLRSNPSTLRASASPLGDSAAYGSSKATGPFRQANYIIKLLTLDQNQILFSCISQFRGFFYSSPP
jgi:hypothetical protein